MTDVTSGWTCPGTSALCSDVSRVTRLGETRMGINEAAAAWLVEMPQLKARHVCVRESLQKNVSTPHVGSAARARLGFPQSRSDPAAPLLASFTRPSLYFSF